MGSEAATGTALDPAELLDALEVASEVLSDHAAALDRLAAGDGWDRTVAAEALPAGPGTDLATTLRAACRAAADGGARDFASQSAELVRGSRSAATGPAGRRLVKLLDGAAEVLRSTDRLDGLRLALALEAGAERLTPADDGRRPGRFPAVAAAAADGALAAADDGAGLADVLVAAADAGLAELEHGAQSDPDLASRGVVDAAAAGFLLLLDAVASVVTGEPLPAPPSVPADDPGPSSELRAESYELRCRVVPHDGCGPEEAAEIRSAWHELGRLVAFEVRGGEWQVELHTPRPGAAVEALVRVGTPQDLHIAVLSGGAARR